MYRFFIIALALIYIGLTGCSSSTALDGEVFLDGKDQVTRLALVDVQIISESQFISYVKLKLPAAEIENKSGDFDDAAQLVGRVEELSKQVYVAQAFSSLEHLRKGGRIGLASSMIAGVLGIIPNIGTNEEGKLVPIDKKRGWKKSLESIVQHVSENVGQKAVRLALVHFESDQLDNLREEIKDRFVIATDKDGNEYDVMECKENMVTAAHSGPDAVGLGALIVDR